MAVDKRKLTAILNAAVVGYSRLMDANEEATVAALNACRAIFRDAIESRQGRVVDTAGVNAPSDNILAEFLSAVVAIYFRSVARISRGISNFRPWWGSYSPAGR